MRRLLFASLITLLVVPIAWTTQPAWAGGSFAPDPSWQTDAVVRSIAYHRSTMYIGGEFTSMRPAGAAPGTGEVARNHVAAINLKTGNLRPWKPDVNGTVFAIEVVGSTVYLGGSFTRVNGVARRNLAAVNRTTGHLLKWNPRADNTVREIQRGPEGTLFLGGRFTTIDGTTRTHIAEITAGGKLTRWGPRIGQISGFACPPRCPPNVFTIAFSVNGRLVYFGGHFGTVNGTPRDEVAAVRIDDDRALRAWEPDPYADAHCPTCTTPETSRVYNLIVTKDKAYMCGGFWKVRDGTMNSYNVLVTNLTNGAPDPTFAAGDDGDTLGWPLRLCGGGLLTEPAGRIGQVHPGQLDGAATRRRRGRHDGEDPRLEPEGELDHGTLHDRTGTRGRGVRWCFHADRGHRPAGDRHVPAPIGVDGVNPRSAKTCSAPSGSRRRGRD
jgi:hypothetical protein